MIEENNFKLIAIRPLAGCDPDFLKNLVEGQVYSFYNDYRFYSADGHQLVGSADVSQVLYTEVVPRDLYRFKKKGQKKHVDVNICAVVGKNGSGKSNLLELFYLFCFAIASSDEILPGNRRYLSMLSSNNERTEYGQQIRRNKEMLKKVFAGLAVEVFFSFGYVVYSMLISQDFILDKTIPCFSDFTVGAEPDVDRRRIGVIKPGRDRICKKFFYSIAVNYSLYGLNSNHSNSWLDFLFHKNDGYQTPIVINPYREDGNINMNTEFHLAQTRMLTNLMSENFNSSEVISGKFITELEFHVFPFKEMKINGLGYREVFKAYQDKEGKSIIDLFSRLLSSLSDYNLAEDIVMQLEKIASLDLMEKKTQRNILGAYYRNFTKDNFSYVPFLYLIAKYSVAKVYRICKNYSDFREFRTFAANKKKPMVLERVDFGLIDALREDDSHITLKLKQILNVVKHRIFLNHEDLLKWKRIENKAVPLDISYRFTIGTNELKDKLASIDKLNKKIEEFLPVAFFKPEFFVTPSDGIMHHFNKLSSGEQQQIHSIQSILYHINNLDSVFRSRGKDAKIKYSNVNIVLDEIELYYHPEFQRTYIKELLDAFARMKMNNIVGINIVFSTHSPFILSDIPQANILRLDSGHKVEYNSDDRTFSANIHDMLANEFFLEDGYMGALAVEKIRELLAFLKGSKSSDSGKWSQGKALKFIDLIGEPLIRNTLRQLYFDRFTGEIDREIQRLETLKKTLGK